jgi:hypothetical protein
MSRQEIQITIEDLPERELTFEQEEALKGGRFIEGTPTLPGDDGSTPGEDQF